VSRHGNELGAMQTFVISDTHFGHANMTKYHGRPERFDRVLIENWNRVVGKQDLIIHLGDVAVSRTLDLPSLIKRLYGRKILCLGNHDRRPANWYMANGFAFACSSFVLDGVCFSHRPVTPLPPGALLNVHGHFHGDDHRVHEYEGNDYFHNNRDRYVEIHIEENLSPVLLSTILAPAGHVLR
jgi:calcineurin-like phosphoesterase family protein